MAIFKKIDTKENIKKHSIIVSCDCGCEQSFKFEFDDDLNEYFISVLGGAFSERQSGIFKIIKRRLYAAWMMLRGKEYRLCDICLTEEQYKKFIKELNQLKLKD